MWFWFREKEHYLRRNISFVRAKLEETAFWEAYAQYPTCMYQPLLSSPPPAKSDADLDDNLSDEGHSSKHPTSGSSSGWTRELCLAVIICIVCVFINVALAAFPLAPRRATTAETRFGPMSVRDVRDLRRPSHFIGLDKIERTSPQPQYEFNNFPLLITQVDSANRNKVFTMDARKYMPHSGTISPQYYRFLVDNTISTIVQFRALDWGMERCQLLLNVPAAKTDRLLRPGHHIAFSLYRLNTTQQLDANTLSYANKPERAAKVADIVMNHNHEVKWERNFGCAREQLLTFEVACSINEDEGSGCSVEWWQDMAFPSPAIYMVQHSTV